MIGGTSSQPERIPGENSNPSAASPDDSYQCDPLNYDTAGTDPGVLANLAMPSGAICNQGVCPRGYYCPEETAWPVICPSGTYNLNYGEVAISGCIECIEGYYCPDTLSRVGCAAGTICP